MSMMVPLRRLVSVVNGGTPTSEADNWDGDVHWATPVDVGTHHGGVITDTIRTLTEQGLKTGSASVPAGSVILSTRAPVGYVAQAGVELAFNQGCKGLVTTNDTHPGYLSYALIHSVPAMQATATGTTFAELSTTSLSALRVPLWPLDEQRLIADFLDRETAQIDAMIEAQQDLVAGLEERRDAVVLQIVRGDGCEWPYRPLKHFVRRVSGSGFPVEEQGIEGLPLPFYKVGALAPAGRDGRIIEVYDTVDHVTARRLGAKVVPAGSPVMAKIGAAVLLGRVRQVTRDCCVDNNMVALVTNGLMDDRFAYFALQQFDIKYFVNPGTLPFLNERSLLDAPIPVPSIEKQRAIAAELDRATVRMDDVIDAANESIALMQERRAALISAAVTGRIDPRTGEEYPIPSEETP